MVVFSWVLLVITLFTTRKDGGILAKTTAVWPSGSYGLPKPTSGCPKSDGVNVMWKEGWREQDMEDNQPRNQFSPSFHMEANLTTFFNIRRSFCIKETNQTRNNIEWPKGSFCIYKNGDCPINMTSGSIEWDDEDIHNQNEQFGTLPSGNYNEDTTIYYCCQNQDHWYNSIVLPTNRPFYLLPRNVSRCQRVKWALSSLEYIIYDTEDFKNRDRFNGSHPFSDRLKGLPKIYYCYYYGCRHHVNGNTGSLTSTTTTHKHYPNYQFCSWLITVDERLVVSLKFHYIQIPDCQENYIDFYDGSNMTSPFLARLCGLNATEHSTLISTDNKLFLVFKSGNNSARTELGFNANYSARLNPKRTLRSTLTSFVQSSTEKGNVKYNDHFDNSNDSTAIIPIVLPIFAVFFVLILILITVFYRRMNQIKNIVQSRTNPSYDIRTNIAVQGEALPRDEAPYENPQEVVWQENESMCREFQNPIEELGEVTNFENVVDEPTYEQIAEIDIKGNLFSVQCGTSTLANSHPPRPDNESPVVLISSNKNEKITEEEVARYNAAYLCGGLSLADSETPKPGDVIYYNIPLSSTGYEMVGEHVIMPKEEQAEHNYSQNESYVLPSNDSEALVSGSEISDSDIPVSSNENKIMLMKEQAECNPTRDQACVLSSGDSEPPTPGSERHSIVSVGSQENANLIPNEKPYECNASTTDQNGAFPSSNLQRQKPIILYPKGFSYATIGPHANQSYVFPSTDVEPPNPDSERHSHLIARLNGNEILSKKKTAQRLATI